MTTLVTVCRSARLTPAAYQFYCAILRTFPARGEPPDPTRLLHLAERFAVPLGATLSEMAAQDLLQLEVTTGAIRAAYPFSGVPTLHRVTLLPDAAGSSEVRAERQVYAMCALDALGIPLMLGCTATIASEDALTHEPVQVTLAPQGDAPESALDGCGWRARWDPPGTVIFARDAAHAHEHDGGCAAEGLCCPVTNFFTEVAHCQQWALAHPVADGMVLTPAEALRRAHALFGRVLHRLEVPQP